jgi:DNA repair exonuclease SbcCD nuclease subunit
MTTIIISDTHFGVKQGSIRWLNAQLDFIYNELIPKIKELKQKDEVQLVHCGDVFDSRSSINTYIANKVREMFIALGSLCEVYIIAGNHDFYSPDSDQISALNLVLDTVDNIHIVRDKIECISINDRNALLVPWYEFDKKELLLESIKQNDPKYIFCHTDLAQLEHEHRTILKDIEVFSGHIHTPSRNKNLHLLGSTYALTFADANSKRGYYILGKNNFEFIPAKRIIKFWRFYNDEIFNIDFEKIKDDYIEIYIDKYNLLKKEYSSFISDINLIVHNLATIPVEPYNDVNESFEIKSYDLESLCRKNIPQELLDKFNHLINK